MAEESGIRLADLLPERLAMDEAVEEAMCEDPEVRGSRLDWGFIGGEAEEALRGALDCDLLELLAQGWVKARALRDYADPAKHPPGETAIVHLAEHKLARDLHPSLEMKLGPCPPVRLRFTLSLAAQIRGLALSIRDGHVTGGAAGDASVSAVLKYGAVKLHKEKDSKKLKLPGRFAFAPPGVKIPG